MKVLVAGGGIGGLTAALCCLHFGHDVTVFEKAFELGEVGAGIQIPPNAMKVFQALEIDHLIAQNAFSPEYIEARIGETGQSIFQIPLAATAQKRWGAPYLHIHRADYIEALKTALAERPHGSIILGADVEAYRNQTGCAVLDLKDGRRFYGDIVIGADGIRSKIRRQMCGDDKASFTGNVAWRVVVPIERLGRHAPKPTACVWMGRGRHGVTYRLRQGKLANFVGVVERNDWTKEGWAEQGSKAAALNDFTGWHPDVLTIIQAAEPGALYRWALFDRPPLPRWTDGRVALLGDAAHPMLPFLAQGAAMAVEDSWILAREISQVDISLPEALNSYQKNRFGRTSKVQAGSRANMKTFHQHSRVGRLATYGPMWLAGRMLPSLVHKRMDWIYGYDVTNG